MKTASYLLVSPPMASMVSPSLYLIMPISMLLLGHNTFHAMGGTACVTPPRTVDNAVQIAQAAASKITGKQFTEITLHHSDKVKTMGDKKSINVRGQNIVVNPTLFFNNITCVPKTSSDMEQFKSYELAPQPPSLFHDGVMQKPTKSALGTLLKSFAPVQANIPNNCHFVIDGCHLLQSVVWLQPSTYEGVCQCYITYILKHYGAGATTVFDGYRTVSTKAGQRSQYPVTSYLTRTCKPLLLRQHFWQITTIRSVS